MLVLVDKDNKIVKYPYTVEELRKDNPNTSFPIFPSADVLKEFNVYSVNGEPPEFNPYLKSEEVTPVYKDGAWIRTFKTRDATNEEVKEVYDIQADRVKSRRNDLLKECDWTVLPDTDLTEEEVAEWKNYRKTLRDISSSKGYPWKVIWPEKPNVSKKVIQDTPEL